MRKAYAIAGIIACFILVIGCGMFILWELVAQARQPSSIQTRMLPDGKAVMLNAVEYGPTLEFKYTIPEAGRGYDLLDNTNSVVSDEHGCWMRQGLESRRTRSTWPGRWLWFNIPAPPPTREITVYAFPRRGKRVILTLFDRNSNGGEDAVVEFSVPNPDPGPHPTSGAEDFSGGVRATGTSPPTRSGSSRFILTICRTTLR